MKKLYLAIGLGLLIRLLLMPFTLHPDLRGHYLGAKFITQNQAFFTVYDYISRLPRTDPLVQIYGDNFLVYSPLTYWFHSAWLILAGPIINWPLYNHLVLDYGSATHNSGLPWLVFVLKFPYLLVDAVCLWLIFKIVTPAQKTLAAWLWAFNLPLIHSAFMMGQFDILLVVFIFAALYFAKTSRSTLAAIMLALGSGFKPFPIFLLPFLPGNKWKNILVGGLVYLGLISLYLPSPGYRMYALLAPHTDKMWYAQTMVSGSQYLSWYLVGFVLLWWLQYFSLLTLPYWAWLAAPMLLFYSVTHFHPQWFAWVTPFLLLSSLNFKKTLPLLLTLIGCYLVILFSFEPSLHFGLFGWDFSPFSIISSYYSVDRLISFIRSILAATSLALIAVLAYGSTSRR